MNESQRYKLVCACEFLVTKKCANQYMDMESAQDILQEYLKAWNGRKKNKPNDMKIEIEETEDTGALMYLAWLIYQAKRNTWKWRKRR